MNDKARIRKKEKKKETFTRFWATNQLVRWMLLFFIMSVITVLIYPNLIIPPYTYRLGDIAERDIKAPRDFFVEITDASEAKRVEAIEDVRTVYDYDMNLSSRLKERVEKAFDQSRTGLADDKGTGEPDTPADAAETPDATDAVQPVASQGILKSKFEEILGITISTGAFSLLEKEKFSGEVENLILRILSEIMENGVVVNKDLLMREREKGIILKTVGAEDETIIYSLKQFYGLDQAKTMVRVIGHPLLRGMNYNLINLIVDFCQRLIQPNITLNRSLTEERKKKAAAEIKATLYKVKAGEMLLREGERASKDHILKLAALNAQRSSQKVYARSLGAVIMMLYLILIIYFIQTQRHPPSPENLNKDVAFLSVMLILFFLIPKISSMLMDSFTQALPFQAPASGAAFSIPMAASAMTVCLFLGMETATAFSIIISICTAALFQNRFEMFIFFFLSNVMGAFWLQDCRERQVFIKAGVKLGFLNILLATAVVFYSGDATISSMRLVWDWGFAFFGGLAAGIITAGIAPLMEIAFGYTTDITLLELANLERPLLRRLMLEAPGTYHHSVVVGSMVEAAAAAIGANPLLAKTCGYYHDIGKINKPLYFIENQINCGNRHDKLAPSMSSLILIAHVKEGVEIAWRNKLGQVIIDAIRQHHGTSLIRFFYEKARQIKKEENVNIDDFRYPGPRPQTREVGLVMLADVVEASSRTLANPTPSRIQGHVQKLINSVFSDGQLDNCELTLKDLHNIAKSFNKILTGIHHHRIEYEKAPAAAGKDKSGKDKSGKDKSGKDKSGKDKSGKDKKENKDKKEKHEHSDQQPPAPGKNSDRKPPEKSESHLKRLGVS